MPLNRRGTPSRAYWDVPYDNVSLPRLTDFLETEGLRLDGTATGRNRLEWPIGKWAEKRGEGELNIQPPAGLATMTRDMPSTRLSQIVTQPDEEGPFNPRASLGYLALGGQIVYELDPEWIVLRDSWAATSKTFVSFQGRTAFGQRSEIPFHVTSLDWQESDRVLAGIMTVFGASTSAVPIGGYGGFDGVMRESFGRPRIEGRFWGERLKAWDVVWGSGRADLTIQNSYAFVSNSVLATSDSEIRADGQFSLGFPRKDGGEEIDARIRMIRRPLADLRHAFELDDYNMEGLVSGEYHIFGHYLTPHGFGRLIIEKGVAYGESFDVATAALRFEGNGVRLDSLEIAKGTGTVTGAAWVGWDGTYSFDADGRRIPVESLDTVSFPRAPLSGLLYFNATGAGAFESPRYDVKLRVDDLFAGDEGIGQLTSRLLIRDEDLTIAELEVASPRLALSGSGRMAMTPEMDGEISLRFTDTSLDPYVRFFQPRLSPFTTAIVSGTVRIFGELANVDQLVVDATVEQADLKLFDYQIRNEGPIQFALDQNVIEIRRLRLAGEGTQLQVGGKLSLRETDCDRGAWRRQPRNPAGLLPRYPQPGTGDADRPGHRAAERAGVRRVGDDFGRSAAPFFAAALARRDQRHDCVCARRTAARRRERPSRWRRRELWRADRARRLFHRQSEPDRVGHAHEPALPRGLSLGRQRGSGADRHAQRSHAERERPGAGRTLVARLRYHAGSLQPRRRFLDDVRRRRAGADDSAAVRRQRQRAVDAEDREQRGVDGRERGSPARRNLRSAHALRPAEIDRGRSRSKATGTSSGRAAWIF